MIPLGLHSKLLHILEAELLLSLLLGQQRLHSDDTIRFQVVELLLKRRPSLACAQAM